MRLHLKFLFRISPCNPLSCNPNFHGAKEKRLLKTLCEKQKMLVIIFCFSYNEYVHLMIVCQLIVTFGTCLKRGNSHLATMFSYKLYTGFCLFVLSLTPILTGKVISWRSVTQLCVSLLSHSCTETTSLSKPLSAFLTCIRGKESFAAPGLRTHNQVSYTGVLHSFFQVNLEEPIDIILSSYKGTLFIWTSPFIFK